MRAITLFASLTAAAAYTLPRAPARCGPPAMMFGDLMKGITKLQAGSYDEAKVRAALENNIKRKPCVMYATSTCPFCKQAQEALTAMGTMYTIVDLDQEDDGMAIKAELMGVTGQTSVPQVFVGGQFIGGCNDGGMGGVLPLKKDGKLEEMLIAAGALVKGSRI